MRPGWPDLPAGVALALSLVTSGVACHGCRVGVGHCAPHSGRGVQDVVELLRERSTGHELAIQSRRADRECPYAAVDQSLDSLTRVDRSGGDHRHRDSAYDGLDESVHVPVVAI